MLGRIIEGIRRFTPTPPRVGGGIRRGLFGDVVVGRGESVPGVYRVAGDVMVEGRVVGDVGCVFGKVTVVGEVGGDVRVLFGGPSVRGTVVGSVEVGYGSVRLEGEARVGGDVTVGSGDVNGSPFGPRSGENLLAPPHVGGRVRTNTVINPAALAEVASLFAVVSVLLLLASLGAAAFATGSVALVAAAAGGVIVALVGAFLWGFALGAKAALIDVNKMRRLAECKGGRGCEWVFPPQHPLAGEPLPSDHGSRYYRPFGRVPGVRRTPLGRLEYDLAERLSTFDAPGQLPGDR